MELRITLLVPTWFTSAPDYPSFEVAGLIVRRPPNSSYNARETIDGVAYSGIVRDYQIYPQRAATYLLDNLVVNLEYAHPDSRKPVEVALKLRPIRFEGTIPAPASRLGPFLATSRLVLEQNIEGALDELEVGDAVNQFSREFRRPRGLYLAYSEREHIDEILNNRSNPNIELIVVSDGEGVLGIGDQGVGAMDIPVAKIMNQPVPVESQLFISPMGQFMSKIFH